MNNHKTLSLVSFLGMGILGLAFLYNIIFALASGVGAALSVNIAVLFLPILIALLLVPYGLKKESKQLVFIGNMVGVVSAGLLSYQLARLCFTDTPGLVIILTTVWPFVLLAGSLTMMAYSKKVDFKPIHTILTLVAIGGSAAGVLTSTIYSIVVSIRISSGLPFGAYISISLAFLALAPIAFFAFALKDEARLVGLEVPEWVKPVKPTPAPKVEPASEPKVEEKKAESKEEATVEHREDMPKA